jgi:hypothetical protein
MRRYDPGVDVSGNARKHGVSRSDIDRVLAAPLRSVDQGATVLHIGVAANRDLLEVVVAPGEPPTVVHAMRLRPFNYRHLDTRLDDPEWVAPERLR